MLPENPVLWTDREVELQSLRRAIENRESLVITRPGGIGKTALLARVLSALESPVANRCFYLTGVAKPRDLRRLATVLTLVEDALERIQPLVAKMERAGGSHSNPSNLTPEEGAEIRRVAERLRHRMKSGAERFRVRPAKPEPRQALAGEHSALWVVLENALPKRMKGYGRALTPADKADWEDLIHSLASDLERIRRIAFPPDSKAGKQKE